MDPEVEEAFAQRDRERRELVRELRARDDELHAQARMSENFAAGSTEDRRQLHRRLARVVRQVFLLLIALFIVQLLIGGAVLLVNADQSETAERGETLAQQIQVSRLEQIRLGCEAQNRRNHATFTLLKNLPPNPRPGLPKRGTPAYTRLLQRFTNALAGPLRDCDRVVRRLANSARGS